MPCFLRSPPSRFLFFGSAVLLLRSTYRLSLPFLFLSRLFWKVADFVSDPPSHSFSYVSSFFAPSFFPLVVFGVESPPPPHIRQTGAVPQHCPPPSFPPFLSCYRFRNTDIPRSGQICPSLFRPGNPKIGSFAPLPPPNPCVRSGASPNSFLIFPLTRRKIRLDVCPSVTKILLVPFEISAFLRLPRSRPFSPPGIRPRRMALFPRLALPAGNQSRLRALKISSYHIRIVPKAIPPLPCTMSLSIYATYSPMFLLCSLIIIGVDIIFPCLFSPHSHFSLPGDLIISTSLILDPRNWD